MFDPSEIEREVSTLSGGERNRLLLAKILASPKEILILDEPTNDLDMETIDLLIDFINLHRGSSLISSHDLDFLKKTCSKFFFLDGFGNIRISTNLERSSFLEEEVVKHIRVKKEVKPINTEKIINRILKKIEKKELEISNLTKELQSIQDYNDKSSHYQSLIGHIHKVQNELKSLEKEWLEIEEGYLINEQ